MANLHRQLKVINVANRVGNVAKALSTLLILPIEISSI